MSECEISSELISKFRKTLILHEMDEFPCDRVLCEDQVRADFREWHEALYPVMRVIERLQTLIFRELFEALFTDMMVLLWQSFVARDTIRRKQKRYEGLNPCHRLHPY